MFVFINISLCTVRRRIAISLTGKVGYETGYTIPGFFVASGFVSGLFMRHQWAPSFPICWAGWIEHIQVLLKVVMVIG
ncbi:hypothetical protein Hdeb2414_s0022g00616481 [Helianthus debilis subsp. tardiflorus]